MAVKGKGGAGTAENSTVEEKTTETANAVKTADTVDETVTLIYVGPTLPKALLKTNQIFTGTQAEIETNFAAAIEKYPTIKHLFVTADRLAEMKRRVATPGNIYNKYCMDIASAAYAELTKEG